MLLLFLCALGFEIAHETGEMKTSPEVEYWKHAVGEHIKIETKIDGKTPQGQILNCKNQPLPAQSDPLRD